MAEKTAQELYADVRKSLVEVGQHGIAWQLDKAFLALRIEQAKELAEALDKQASELVAGKSAILHDDATGEVVVVPYEPIDVPVIIEAAPVPGAPGEGGGASSQAGVESKDALPGGVIA